MKLWGRVMSGFMLAMAAVFAVLAIVVPEARLALSVTMALLTAAGVFGVPAVVRLFSSFTGDEEVLQNGVVASATVVALKPTGWRYNRHYPIVRFELSVERGGVAYPVKIRQAVEPELLERLSPGAVVGVRVDSSDRKKVVVDTRQPIRVTESKLNP
jgi:hypothetical protein